MHSSQGGAAGVCRVFGGQRVKGVSCPTAYRMIQPLGCWISSMRHDGRADVLAAVFARLVYFITVLGIDSSFWFAGLLCPTSFLTAKTNALNKCNHLGAYMYQHDLKHPECNVPCDWLGICQAQPLPVLIEQSVEQTVPGKVH